MVKKVADNGEFHDGRQNGRRALSASSESRQHRQEVAQRDVRAYRRISQIIRGKQVSTDSAIILDSRQKGHALESCRGHRQRQRQSKPVSRNIRHDVQS